MKSIQSSLIKRGKEFVYKNKVFSYYGITLLDLAEKFKNIFVVSGDTSRRTPLEDFIKKKPESFINVGIAEQNLIGVASGLASEGFVTYVQTNAAFLITRGYEFVKNLVCYDNLNVKLLGYSSGLSTANAGFTHWAINDIAIAKTLPNIKLLCPSDVFDVAKAVALAYSIPGPVYIRLPKPYYNPNLVNNQYLETYGHREIKKGNKIIVFSYGYCLKLCYEAILESSIDGIGLIDQYAVHPLDEKAILKTIQKTNRVLVVEEHIAQGSLYSSLTDICCKHKLKVEIYGQNIHFSTFKTGEYPYLLELNQIDTQSILQRIKELSR